MDILSYDYYEDNLVLLDESCEEVVVKDIEGRKARGLPLGHVIYFFANIDTEVKSNFKVGDRIRSVLHGEGEIVNLYEDRVLYAVVKYERKGDVYHRAARVSNLEKVND